MSNEKFTPGDWGILGSGEHGFVYITDNPQKDIQDKHIICQVQTNTRHSTIANAHLISAAPDMYRMLEQLHGALSAVPVLQVEIETVLKKARGEK